MHIHGYSLTEIENMISWERKIYLNILNGFIQEENLKKEQLRSKNRI